MRSLIHVVQVFRNTIIALGVGLGRNLPTGGLDQDPGAFRRSDAVLDAGAQLDPGHDPAVVVAAGVVPNLDIRGHALGAKHGGQELGHLVADAAAVLDYAVGSDIDANRALREGLVVFQVADPFSDGFDILQLGLLRVPELFSLSRGIGGVLIVAPRGGDEIGREFSVDGLYSEAVLVLDAVILTVVCDVSNGVLVFACAVDEGDLNRLVFCYVTADLFVIGALQDEASRLTLGREGDIAISCCRPIDSAIAVVHLGIFSIRLAGRLDGLDESFDLTVLFERGLRVKLVLVPAGDAVAGTRAFIVSVPAGDAGQRVDFRQLAGIGDAGCAGAARALAAAGGKSDGHDGREKHCDEFSANGFVHGNHDSFLS